MSYKAAVLYDYPIAYYPLDDLTTVDLVQDFTDFLAQFSTYQDVLDNVSSYANIYGDVAYDHSGCENDGNYIGDPETEILPIVAGNGRATKITNQNSVVYNITNDYTATATNSQFGTASSSDNDFTIEFWFYPSFTTTAETPIVADPTNEVGVFYEKGNITFKVETQEVSYTLPSVNKVFYVACSYNQNYLYIYIDGVLVEYKQLTNFVFTNESLSLISGPTSNASDYFLINSVGIYRYELSQESIQYHMYEGRSLLPTQVAQADSGQVFNIYDNGLTQTFKYEYPTNKSWNDIVEDGLYYIETESAEYLEMIKTESAVSSTVVLNDFIPINPSITADRSKIEWAGDNGITVEVSTDGTTYTSCINGEQIPGYTLNNFGNMEGLYLRITMASSDTSKFIPRLYKLIVTFYNGQTLYAENGYAYITSLEGDNAVSDYRITFGNNKYDILSRHKLNGLKTVIDSGFHVTTADGISTVEFFYTPFSLTTSGLISTVATNGYSASNISWNNLGTMSKTNISALYVNGVNKTSETNVSNIFKDDQLHHVVVVFASAVSNEIRFNYSLSGSVPALYQYISIYPNAFNSTKAADHYDYYIRRDAETITDSSTLTMTEDSVNYYNNDWVVIQNT
jgi:hypothetical protein